MDKAKAAVKDFTSRVGHHDTTVHEHSKPAATHEHITPTRHDEAQTVVDKEIHQDHYHTSVQPLQDRQVLPEKHEHKLLPTEEKEFRHGDSHGVKERVATDAAQYKDVTEVGATKHTQSAKAQVGGEHVHHHIHETIQPVIQKETIQPEVVHTTKPIHEVHHNAPQHHNASVLPAVNLADFQKQSGSLTGAPERVTHFEGEPDSQRIAGGAHHGGTHGVTGHTGTQSHGVAGTTERGVPGTQSHGITGASDRGAHGNTHQGLAGAGAGAGAGALGAGALGSSTRGDSVMDRERPVAGHHGAGSGATGALGSTTTTTEHRDQSRMDPRVDSGSHRAGHDGVPKVVENRSHHPSERQEPVRQQFADTHIGSGVGGNTTNASNFESANIRQESVPEQTKAKPSLLDKLDPRKDANGDGQKGFMK